MNSWEDSILSINDQYTDWRFEFTKYLDVMTKLNKYRFFWEMIPMIRFITGTNGIAWTDNEYNIFLNIPHEAVALENDKWEFIYYHECLHQLFETFKVGDKIKEDEGGLNHQMLNIASDCIINDHIKSNYNLDYPTKNLITPEYLKEKYGIEYVRKEDDQYDLYMKLKMKWNEIKDDPLIQKNLENMPDIDIDIQGAANNTKTVKVPTTADWKQGSKAARKIANDILAKYNSAIQKQANGKISKEDAITAIISAIAELEQLIGHPVKPVKEHFNQYVLNSARFIFENESNEDNKDIKENLRTFEQGWDYAINDVINQANQLIQQLSMTGGGNDGNQNNDDENWDTREVPENDPTEEAPFLPKPNMKGGSSSNSQEQQDQQDKQQSDNNSNNNSDNNNSGSSDQDIDKMTPDEAAKNAQESANKAKTAADQAQKAADDAKQKAQSAQEKADRTGDANDQKAASKAKKNAEKSQNAADKAKNAAEKAQDDANEAKDAADKGDDETAKKKAKDARKSAEKAKSKSDEAKENDNDSGYTTENGIAGKTGESERNLEPEIAERSDNNQNVDWDSDDRETAEKNKGRGTQIAEIRTYAAKKIGKMGAKDAQAVIRKFATSMDSSLGDFVRKCRNSTEKNQRGVIMQTPMQRRNTSWAEKFSDIIKNTVKQYVKKRSNEWFSTYRRPSRRQGIVHDNDIVKKGKMRKKDKLTISIAFYVDVSYSMDQTSIKNIFNFIYKLDDYLKSQYGANEVVEDCVFDNYAFNEHIKKIIRPDIPVKNGGTFELNELLDNIYRLSKDYMINVILTDAEMGKFKIDDIKQKLKQLAGNVVFITDNSDVESALAPLKNLSGTECGNKFEFIKVEENFNITSKDFNQI